MKDEQKDKKELLQELAKLRRHISRLEKLEAKNQQTDDVLKESERRFRNLFEGVNDALIYLDKKGTILGH